MPVSITSAYDKLGVRPYAPGGHEGPVGTVAFNPPAVPGKPGRDGRWLVTLTGGTGGGFARLWDLKARILEESIVLDGHGRPTKLILSVDGRGW